MYDPTLSLQAGLLLMAAVIGVLLWRSLTSPGREIEKLVRQIRAGERPDFPERRTFDHDIRITETGFEIIPVRKHFEEVCRCDWTSVRRVTAFKEDLVTTDCVCLAFELPDGSAIAANEEMGGWLELCDALPAHLPGTPLWEKWRMAVALPAFAPCITPLYPADCVTLASIHNDG